MFLFCSCPLHQPPPKPTPPDPPQDRPPAAGDGPKSTGFLLGLVRKLIDYGQQLAATLRQHPPATPLRLLPSYAGTIDIGLVLARIACGLQRAAALEARLLQRARQEEKPPPTRPPSPRRPCAARPAARRAAGADPGLARLPTAAEIAIQVRRRPVGAVIADICRDLGIMPADPLWRELQRAIIVNGGNFAALVMRMIKGHKVWITDQRLIALYAWPAAWPPAEAYTTGPP